MGSPTKSIPLPALPPGPRTRAARQRAAFGARSLLEGLQSELIAELAQTEVVARLRKVSFLGAIDHSPWARHAQAYLTSRFDHSIGVALLAKSAARKLKLSARQRDTALAAALLHDVGHGPLSHSLESAFAKTFGIDHHKATEDRILGPSASSRALRAVLKQFRVDANEVVRLMNGEAEHPLAAFFSGPINFDTVEGILRTANYRGGVRTGLDGGTTIDALVQVWMGHATQDLVGVLDRFWQTKGLCYSQLVRGNLGVVSDHKCQLFFDANRHRFRPEHFAWDDAAFSSHFPELFCWLGDDAAPAVKLPDRSSIAYVRRLFEVSTSHSLGSSTLVSMRARYRQHKKPAVLDWPHRTTTAREPLTIWETNLRSATASATPY
ncbi:HD domain-containing protein [Variovorax sp. KK3]|uniref:HD domain-containing protein n=1 Tax=Variovorax sp. KK3 TaxID=1855728 RepID=UPI00097BF6E3|nr:HD domain-containing protein [Variovorax sp. KK3]